MDHTEVSVVLDNDAIYEICQKWMDIKRPTYDEINRMINKAITTITAPLRFDEDVQSVAINYNLEELQTNLVCFPRLHFMITSMTPIMGKHPRRSNFYRISDIQRLSEYCFDSKLFFTEFSQICKIFYNYSICYFLFFI